jgi:hypothetical protein
MTHNTDVDEPLRMHHYAEAEKIVRCLGSGARSGGRDRIIAALVGTAGPAWPLRSLLDCISQPKRACTHPRGADAISPVPRSGATDDEQSAAQNHHQSTTT